MERCERSSAGARLREGERLKSCVCTVGRSASTTAAEPPVQFGGDRAHKSVSCKSAGSECQSAAAVLERFSTEQPVRHNTGHQQKAATHWLPAWYSTGHSLCAAGEQLQPTWQWPECQSARVRVWVWGNLDATWTE